MEPSPKSEHDWKRKLSTRIYKIGMTRSMAEKQLGAKVLIEFTADHGFAPLRDVYYELDPQWCAVIAYAPADYSEAERTTMNLVVQPLLVSNRHGLLDELKQRAMLRATEAMTAAPNLL